MAEMTGQLGPQRRLDHPARELADQPARAGDPLQLDALERLVERVTRKQLVEALTHRLGQIARRPQRLAPLHAPVLHRRTALDRVGHQVSSLAPHGAGRSTRTTHRGSDRTPCVDEKSQIQALDRTAPILPLAPGVPERQTHDYKRSGTSSLYAALDLTTGKVIHALRQRHRAIEFRKFLVQIDAEVPAHLDVHLVLDNASTHKTPAIQKWLAAHPRFVLHFTPTSSSWLNLVERWFAELTTKKLQRGAHRSVRELNADIRA